MDHSQIQTPITPPQSTPKIDVPKLESKTTPKTELVKLSKEKKEALIVSRLLNIKSGLRGVTDSDLGFGLDAIEKKIKALQLLSRTIAKERTHRAKEEKEQARSSIARKAMDLILAGNPAGAKEFVDDYRRKYGAK